MAYVITQNCCKDASCVSVCPVDCIRPSAGSSSTDMLYIDPDTCIDCGACMEECPVDAIHYEGDLPPELARFRDINSAYFTRNPLRNAEHPSTALHEPMPPGALRVAVVGTGPAACYAAAELVDVAGVQLNIFERLPTPFGLIRAGVAPDHQDTKQVIRVFEHALSSKRTHCFLNVEVGTTISHDELMAHHHAVIYATGASEARELTIPGADLAGVHAAAEFVGWYNGHPDRAGENFDLSGRRVVIIGNGNVALDVARILLVDSKVLGTTDISDHALDGLRNSQIDEVIVMARRGVRDAAFSVGEFLAVGNLENVDVIIDGDLDEDPGDDPDASLKIDIARAYAARPTTPGHRRLVFKFGATPVEVSGTSRADALRIRATSDADGAVETVEAQLILSCIGYRAPEFPGLPYDADRGLIPNVDGRVTTTADALVPGVYVTGWVKRGPRGVIGTNRTCAAETVAQLLADFDEGVLDRDLAEQEALTQSLTERGALPVTWHQWHKIDSEERSRGRASSRPRVKLVSVSDMIAVATRQ
ncbi:MAG: FAD-dependent oxidoreductase [Mycobacterium sp.]